MTASTLTDFLLARIGTRSRWAARMMEEGAYYPNRHDPEIPTREEAPLVWAECRAKLLIVERCVDAMDAGAADDGQLMTSGANLAEEILRDLASVYADHPDYQQEWKP